MGRKQNRKKAGDSTKGLFESGEVVSQQEKKTIQSGTLQTAIMKKAGTKGSWWDTPAGKLRRRQMVEDMKHGKLMTRKDGKVVKK
jgi:hypothetical protein